MKWTAILILCCVACGPVDDDPVDANNANNVNNQNNAQNNANNVATNNANNQNNVNNSNQSNNTNNVTNQNMGDVPLADIFDAAFGETGCTAGYCHGGSVDGLVINTADVAIDAMVDVASIRPACGLTKLVVPGEPEQSLLWMRVRPASMETGEPCVPKMPKGSDGLDEETAALIYDWIAAGATL